MNNLVLAAQRFLLDEEGVAAIEYGLLAVAVAIAVIASGKTIGTALSAVFTRVTTCMSATATCA